MSDPTMQRTPEGADEPSRERDLIRAAKTEATKLTIPALSGSLAGGATMIPGYEILREVHRGGQGIVYEAIHLASKRRVAIKLMLEAASAVMDDDHKRARFEREIDLLSRINHPSIVTIHDAGEIACKTARGDTMQFHVMDYIDGEPLDTWLAGSELAVNEILRLFQRICQAVNVAHLHGVIHRDLKPANILIDAAGQPHVLDFGLAKPADDGVDRAITLTGQFLGSVPWASPEQVDDSPHAPQAIDIRTDVYSLGVILYQALTGRFPYDVTGSMRAAIENILHAPPEPMQAVSAGGGRLSAEVETIVLKSLSKDRERRYQSAGELARDIGRYLNGEPIEAKRDSALYVLRKTVARYRLATAAAALIFVLLVGWGASMAVLSAEARSQAQLAEQRRLEAEQARDEAITARIAEQQRAAELASVAAFQESQLSAIDTSQVGVRLRDHILAQKRLTAERLAADPDAGEVEAALQQLEAALTGVNFTTVALKTLDESIFERAMATIIEQFDDRPLLKARLLQATGNVLQDLGLLDRALEAQTAALEIRRELLGTGDPDTLTSITRMGNLLSTLGRPADARAHFEESYEGYRLLYGPEHHGALIARGSICSVLATLRQIGEAEECYLEIIEPMIRVLGEEHIRTSQAVYSFAELLILVGRIDEAEPYVHQNLDIRRRTFGEEHQQTLQSLEQLSFLRLHQGRYAEAEDIAHKTLAAYRRIFGDEHPETLRMIGKVGGLLHAQGMLADAEPYFLEVMQAMQRTLGPAHADTLLAINNVGFVLHAQGRYDESETYFREALEGMRRVLGDDHSTTVFAVSNLGAVYYALGHYDEAEPYFREALERRRRLLGNSHSDTLVSISNLGSLFLARGELDDAEELYLEALDGSRRGLGEDHPGTIQAEIAMVRLLLAQVRLDEAEPLARLAVNKARRILSETHWQTGSALLQHSLTLTAMGRLAEAEPLAVESHAILLRALGPSHERTIAAARHLDTFRSHD